MKLYIGNKNYSSWSFRPWLAMTVKGVSFQEMLVPFDMEAGNPDFLKFSPTGKVPVLIDGNQTIWESQSILEYLADKFPEKSFWPKDQADRADARSIASEMHGGFSALRNECPMNMRRVPERITVSKGVIENVHRIEQIWDDCLTKSGGPFLFGEFCNADAMFAPVVNRLEIYKLSDAVSYKAYSKSMKSLQAWKDWEEAGRLEPWVVAEDEA